MLGGKGRGPLRVPVDLDALLVGDYASRQVSRAALRNQGGDLSGFFEGMLDFSPVVYGTPQTIPSGGAPPVLADWVPAMDTPGVKVGR